MYLYKKRQDYGRVYFHKIRQELFNKNGRYKYRITIYNMRTHFSIKLISGKKNIRKDGSLPVGLVVRKLGKRKIIFLGISAFPEQWNDQFELFETDGRKTKLHPDREKNNEWLGDIKKRCNKILENFDENKVDWTLNQFEQQFLSKSKHTGVEDYFLQHIDKLLNAGKIGNKIAYESTLAMIKLFDAKFGRLMFNDIDLKYIKEFDEYLENERGCGKNTRKYYIKTFRALINKAIKDGVASEATYPFGKNGFSIADLEHETDKRYLPKDYIEKLKTTKIDNFTMQWVRNIFLFSYYCQGMSFVDIASLTKNNIFTFESGKHIVYRRHKTEKKKSKPVKIKISENIQNLLDWFKMNTKIVDDYLTPIVSIPGYEGEQQYRHIKNRYKRYNDHLKSLGDFLGFDGIRLSSYVTRHSYAMRLKNSGIPEDVISEALGHKDLSTTKVYLDSFENDEIAKANEVL